MKSPTHPRSLWACFLDRRASSALLVLFVEAFVCGCSSPKFPPPLVDPGYDLILTNATGVDTQDGHESPRMTVTIRAGKIAGVAPDSAQPPEPTSATPIIDAQGQFLVAGFVDARVHVLGSPPAADDEALMLANGITAFRQMSGSAALLEKRRENRLFASIFMPELLAMPGEVLVTTKPRYDDAGARRRTRRGGRTGFARRFFGATPRCTMAPGRTSAPPAANRARRDNNPPRTGRVDRQQVAPALVDAVGNHTAPAQAILRRPAARSNTRLRKL